ncbi:sensor histidine kinase [Dyadobacter sediminis]|nr:histidine kinase [Dyadobacter sediminis]GGB78751.1 hypothetical protein GCM10011325_02860 [Dyadobacter sediminis]
MVIKKIVNGRVCDSCLVTRAGNTNLNGNTSQVSFLTLNHENQFLYTDSLLTKNFTTVSLSRFFLSVAEFSLDFYTQLQQGLRPEKGLASNLINLQFRTELNGRLQNDWKEIVSLPADPDFYVGYARLGDLSEHADQPETMPLKNFHAGKFRLAVGDSLRVFVRNKLAGGESCYFSIKRVKSAPNHFDFVQFSSAKHFEEILNTEVNKKLTTYHAKNDSLEMEAGNSAFLRFSDDFQYQFFGQTIRNSGIEYAFSDHPDLWRDLGGKNLKFINEYSYIYIHNPKAGQTLKVFLRYKHQRESIHTVTIRVREAAGMAKWMDWTLSIAGLAVLFGTGYLLQKRRYKKQITALNRKKLEVENHLQLLSGQLNPHFLFNSLNAVQGLIRHGDPETASGYIHDVATFLRIIMDSSKKEFVSLQEEIQIEERYLMLEVKRKPFSYSIQNDCGQDLAEIDFPPLLLQPILENSIRHGFADSSSNSQLTIQVNCHKNDLILTVSDNGIGFDPQVNAGGHGLFLIRKRIALLNEKLTDMPITLQITSGQTIGQEVSGPQRGGSQTKITFSGWLN